MACVKCQNLKKEKKKKGTEGERERGREGGKEEGREGPCMFKRKIKGHTMNH